MYFFRPLDFGMACYTALDNKDSGKHFSLLLIEMRTSVQLEIITIQH